MAAAPLNEPHLDGARAMPARASVTVGAVETEYLRVGAGTPVLVLDHALAAAVRRGEVPGAWRAHRLVVPERTTIDALAAPADGHGPTPFDAWLRGMIDGLGLAACTVVASAPLAAEVLRFATRHPDEVVRVLVPGVLGED